MIVLGLTGSIGMGKSTTAGFFREFGIPVHDADAAVHQIYAGRDAAAIAAAFPGVLVDGKVDRTRLGAQVLDDPAALKRLEAIVHPLVRASEVAFLKKARAARAPLVVLDIPLLFETGAEGRVDAVVVVSCSEAEQRRRVLARPGMNEEKLKAVLARQVPDAEKRARADFVVDTNHSLESARAQVGAIIATIRSGGFRPGPASKRGANQSGSQSRK